MIINNNNNNNDMFKKTIIFIKPREYFKSKKTNLPHILREQTWNHYIGNKFETECFCCEKNKITPFKFECAHIIADAKGGSIHLDNLLPCCSQCNKSMGIMNFFVFKSKLLNNSYYDINKLSEEQKDIVKFYNYTQDNLTCKEYSQNFDLLFEILSKNMFLNTNTNNSDIYINKFECDCGYKFVYITKKNKDFELTCKNSNQNIIDVICDHIPCLINKKNFINNTLNSICYKNWKKNQ